MLIKTRHDKVYFNCFVTVFRVLISIKYWERGGKMS